MSDVTCAAAAAAAAAGGGADAATTAAATAATMDQQLEGHDRDKDGDVSMTGVREPAVEEAEPGDEDGAAEEEAEDEDDDDDDDDDDPMFIGMSDEQRRMLKARLAQVQASFQARLEKAREQKVSDLLLAVPNISKDEALVALDMCNNREGDAAEKLQSDSSFVAQVRATVRRKNGVVARPARAAKPAVVRDETTAGDSESGHEGVDIDPEWTVSETVEALRQKVKASKHKNGPRLVARVDVDGALSILQQQCGALSGLAPPASATASATASSPVVGPPAVPAPSPPTVTVQPAAPAPPVASPKTSNTASPTTASAGKRKRPTAVAATSASPKPSSPAPASPVAPAAKVLPVADAAPAPEAPVSVPVAPPASPKAAKPLLPASSTVTASPARSVGSEGEVDEFGHRRSSRLKRVREDAEAAAAKAAADAEAKAAADAAAAATAAAESTPAAPASKQRRLKQSQLSFAKVEPGSKPQSADKDSSAPPAVKSPTKKPAAAAGAKKTAATSEGKAAEPSVAPTIASPALVESAPVDAPPSEIDVDEEGDVNMGDGTNLNEEGDDDEGDDDSKREPLQVQIKPRPSMSGNAKKHSMKLTGEQQATATALRKQGISEARIKAFLNRDKNPNAYYYRFNEIGEAQATGDWSKEEKELFMTLIRERGVNYEWGTLSRSIPGRVGYQCSNFYRKLILQGELVDPNYVIDETGKLKFVRRTKTVQPLPGDGKPLNVVESPRVRNKPSGGSGGSTARLPRVAVTPTPAPTASAPRSSRSRGRRNEEDEEEEEPEAYAWTPSIREDHPVLPNFPDHMTGDQVVLPAISPQGYVMGYYSWLRCLARKKDECPFTKNRVTRRQLVKITDENVEEYLPKIRNLPIGWVLPEHLRHIVLQTDDVPPPGISPLTGSELERESDSGLSVPHLTAAAT